MNGARIWNNISKTDLFRSCKYIANYDWIETSNRDDQKATQNVTSNMSFPFHLFSDRAFLGYGRVSRSNITVEKPANVDWKDFQTAVGIFVIHMVIQNRSV